MNIRFLETVVWLAHDRNFRVTAERLNITQAAVSSRIATVENDLGVRLFDRQSRDVVPTPDGETFVAGAREIVEHYRLLVQGLRVDLNLEGQVRIGLVSAMVDTLLPDIAHTLRLDHPRMRFEVVTTTSGPLLKELIAGRLDLCLTLTPEPVPPRIVVHPLCTLGMFWVAAPKLLPYSDDCYSPADLARFPLISYASGAPNATRISEFLSVASGADHIVHNSNSLATTINMAVNGIGLAVLPAVAVQRELREGSLHVLNVSPAFPPTSYAAISSVIRDTRSTARIVAIAQAAARRLCERFTPSVARLDAPGPR
ncbi:MAG: LysR family transcriptional regulator [Lautropia sp.]